MPKYVKEVIVLILFACTGQESAKPAPKLIGASSLKPQAVAKSHPPKEMVTVRQEPPEYVKHAMQAGVKASAKASTDVPAKGGTSAGKTTAAPSTCNAAFAGLKAVVKELQQADAPGAPGRLPSQARFVQLCESLPPSAQECLVVSYALEHQAHCQGIEAELAPEHKRALRGLLAQGPNAAATPDPTAR